MVTKNFWSLRGKNFELFMSPSIVRLKCASTHFSSFTCRHMVFEQ